ncbi:MAG: hypothetical protein ABJF23_22780 [Bryobacteraceae bacterium]
MALRRFPVFALLAGHLLYFSALCQENAPSGIVRGDLVEWDGNKAEGDILVRTPPDRLYTCHFDAFTYMERDGQRIAMGALRAGDRLEVVADRKPGSQRCYARTVRVVDKPPPTNPGYRITARRSTLIDQLYPRGNLTFSGVILRLNPQMMVLRTRTHGETTVLLRQDTRYMDSGLPAEASMLTVNTRVSIRCGRNLDNEIEAYQVIWGEIEGPKGR